jgi:hypothetical protein
MPESVTRDADVIPIGTTSGIALDIAPGTSAEHSASVCFLSPGLYCLYAAGLEARTPEPNPTVPGKPSEELPVAVEPLFILVEP